MLNRARTGKLLRTLPNTPRATNASRLQPGILNPSRVHRTSLQLAGLRRITPRVSETERALGHEIYALAILDTDLPDMDGFMVLRHLRQGKNNVPVIILTACHALEHQILGPDLGADDCLTKPFALPELEARMRVVIRRGLSPRMPQLTHGPLLFDAIAKRSWLRGQPLELTAREWSLLEFLLLHAGCVISKEQLLEALCPWNREITLNAIEVYVSRLRAKLEVGAVIIRTVHGRGYLLANYDDVEGSSGN
jgi:DNA-binding response OmpR family regulator